MYYFSPFVSDPRGKEIQNTVKNGTRRLLAEAFFCLGLETDDDSRPVSLCGIDYAENDVIVGHGVDYNVRLCAASFLLYLLSYLFPSPQCFLILCVHSCIIIIIFLTGDSFGLLSDSPNFSLICNPFLPLPSSLPTNSSPTCLPYDPNFTVLLSMEFCEILTRRSLTPSLRDSELPRQALLISPPPPHQFHKNCVNRQLFLIIVLCSFIFKWQSHSLLFS